MSEHLIIAGRGGVGKSTTAANLAAALAQSGRSVLLIGYSANASSTAILRSGRDLLPLPDWQHGPIAPLYAAGGTNALCFEMPGPGGSDGSGDSAWSRYLLRHPVVTGFQPEFVIHDLDRQPGSSFALPEAAEGVTRLFLVTSADLGAINTMNDIFAWLNTVAAVECRFGGIIGNSLSGPLCRSVVADYAAQTGATVVANIPHSLTVSISGFYRETMKNAAPFSPVASAYRNLAQLVLESKEVRRPSFLMRGALRQWALRWGEITAELEAGMVQGGSSI